jgi:hypothetical protein
MTYSGQVVRVRVMLAVLIAAVLDTASSFAAKPGVYVEPALSARRGSVSSVGSADG